MSSGWMRGKKGWIVGLANERSIAAGVARALHMEGAELALTYQNERLQRKVEVAGEALEAYVAGSCDVLDLSSVTAVVERLRERFGTIDFLVHSVAFSDRKELMGRYLDTTRDNFVQTMEISCYSLVALARACEPILAKDASIVTLTYYGAEKVVKNYNVMGVAKAALEASVRYLAADMGPQGQRINAISSGAIATLAASGIHDFKKMLKMAAATTPLRRGVTVDEVGRAALFLLSDLGSGVTGEILHVDGGYNVMGAAAEPHDE